MIALNRELPQTCYECPCFQTLTCSDDMETYMIRRCAAAGSIIYETTLRKYHNDKEIEKRWFDFTKPANCPWEEI